jgi:hypothetical protein
MNPLKRRTNGLSQSSKTIVVFYVGVVSFVMFPMILRRNLSTIAFPFHGMVSPECVERQRLTFQKKVAFRNVTEVTGGSIVGCHGSLEFVVFQV